MPLSPCTKATTVRPARAVRSASSSAWSCGSRPTRRGRSGDDDDERLTAAATPGSPPNRRSTAAPDGRASGSRRKRSAHSASRSLGTPGTISRGRGGSNCCFSIKMSGGDPENGSRPVSAS